MTPERNRLRTQADRSLTTLNLTRSEAVKRNQSVSICRSSDGASCTGNWEDGWIVFTNVATSYDVVATAVHNLSADGCGNYTLIPVACAQWVVRLATRPAGSQFSVHRAEAAQL